MTEQRTLLRLRQAVGGLVLLSAVGLSVWFFSGSSEISQRGYQYALALMSVCNRQDEQRLQLIIERIQADREQQALSPRDARWLLKITARAQQGDWQGSAAAVRSLMKQQQRRQSIPVSNSSIGASQFIRNASS